MPDRGGQAGCHRGRFPTRTSIFVVDLETGNPLSFSPAAPIESSALHHALFLSSDTAVWRADDDRNAILRVMDLKTGDIRSVPTGLSRYCSPVVCSPDGTRLVTFRWLLYGKLVIMLYDF